MFYVLTDGVVDTESSEMQGRSALFIHKPDPFLAFALYSEQCPLHGGVSVFLAVIYKVSILAVMEYIFYFSLNLHYEPHDFPMCPWFQTHAAVVVTSNVALPEEPMLLSC